MSLTVSGESGLELATPLSSGPLFASRPVVLRLRLAADLPFTAERSSALVGLRAGGIY